MKIPKVYLFIIFSLISVTLVSTSCKRKKDTIAKIYVRDINNNFVSGARVILKGVSTTNKSSNVADTAYTNSGGEAIFNFNELYQLGQAGVAVLDIFADKDGVNGTGVIQIEEETTSTSTVFLNQ